MATTATQPAYELVIHRHALRNWRGLPIDVRGQFDTILDECSRLRTPSEHEKASLMRGCTNIFRIRKGNYRLLADKHHNRIRVLAVDHREYIYSKTQMAKERAQDE